MTNPYVDALGWQALLGYDGAQIPAAHVARIPVSGPAPFNTLLQARALGVQVLAAVADSKVHRWRVRSRTPYQMPGYVPGQALPFAHSTAIFMRYTGQTNDQDFQEAVESIEASFDEYGTLVFDIQIAAALESDALAASYDISSWVLVREPVTEPAKPEKPVKPDKGHVLLGLPRRPR